LDDGRSVDESEVRIVNTLLLGFGEVGQALYKTFKPYHDIDVLDKDGWVFSPSLISYTILMVAIPCHDTDKFVTIVSDTIKKYGIKHTIIFSSIPIGTTSKIPNSVHSPVEGRHSNLAHSMIVFKRFVGGKRTRSLYRFFKQAGFNVEWVKKPEWTEAIKLMSTTNYGINIEYGRFMDSLCKTLDIPWELVKQYNESYNRLYAILGENGIKRYILNPPKGKIGGHCVRQNAELLRMIKDSPFLDCIRDGGFSENR
jgi:hypothetical protein